MTSKIVKVLLVDDDPSIRLAQEATLSDMGFHLTRAGRGDEALSLIRLTQFQVVLLDINMPD